MEREKMIEEMAKIVDEMYNVYTTTAEDIAEGIYNAGYRKIDKDSVVLSREEYIDLSRNYVKEQKAQAVKEFAKKLKEKFNGYEATYYNGFEEGFHDLQEEIDELLKEYEV